MTLATSIVQIIASILSMLAARGLDQVLGKWVAYFSIAWEKVASQAALDEYKHTKDNLATSMADKLKQWDDWRKGLEKNADTNVRL